MQIETRIQVADVPEEGLYLNFSELSHVIPEVDGFVKIGNTKGRLEIHKSGNNIEVRGSVKSRVLLTCDRCLGRFHKNVETSFFYLLQPRKDFGAGLETDHRLSHDEVDVYWYEDGEIRGEEIFREQIILQLPMRMLCSESCKGLCPSCGINLNEAQCSCSRQVNDGPFAALAVLKVSR